MLGGPLEHHVLEQMGEPVGLGDLVPASDVEVDADGGGADLGQGLGGHHHAVGQAGGADVEIGGGTGREGLKSIAAFRDGAPRATRKRKGTPKGPR